MRGACRESTRRAGPAASPVHAVLTIPSQPHLCPRGTPPSPRPSPPEEGGEGAGCTAGFTLLEMVAVMAVVAMLAAILLPALPWSTSRQRLAGYAVETAALLKADRSAAVQRNVLVSAQVDAPGHLIRSGSTGQAIAIPADVSFEAVLPRTCNERPAHSTISFFATGMSCGGTIILSRLGAGFEIRVNWLTGGIEIVPREAT
jgi:general secretion pathway protein H